MIAHKILRATLEKLPNPALWIKRHVQGEYSLVRAFWLHYFFLTEMVLSPFLYIWWATIQAQNPDHIWPLIVFICVAWAGIATACVGVWRSAGRYTQENAKPLWGNAAKAFIAITLAYRTAAMIF